MKILSVKKYNALAEERYNLACKNWKSQIGGFPALSMFIYKKKYGYILKTEFGSKWFRSKKQAAASKEK